MLVPGRPLTNTLHRWICRSSFWRATLEKRVLPWALYGLDLGSSVLEVGPGFGMATDVLRGKWPRVFSVEIDSHLARSLGRRLNGSNACVIQGDGAALPFRDGAFTGAVCFTMLHHVPSAELQDRLMAEVCRVLQPGGMFAGTDSTWSRAMQWLHYRDTLVTIDPQALAARLQRAGFADVDIRAHARVFRFRARRP
jgi:SAM-dependent methyltransferase